MTRNTDAKQASEPGPCAGCVNRKTCADPVRPKACVAFERFDSDPKSSTLEWRDAPRDPSELIGRRLVVRWHGAEVANRLYPIKTRGN